MGVRTINNQMKITKDYKAQLRNMQMGGWKCEKSVFRDVFQQETEEKTGRTRNLCKTPCFITSHTQNTAPLYANHITHTPT